VRDGRWEAARNTLAQAVKHRVIAPAAANHHRGVIVYEMSLAALTRGERQRGLALAAEAQALAPDLVPAAASRARLLLEDQRTRRAAKAVERAWRTAPHPQLAQVFGAIWKSDPPLARVARFERLAAQNPAARESHIALAEAALAAQLWGEARRHLERALAAEPPPAASIPSNAISTVSTPAPGKSALLAASAPGGAGLSKQSAGPSVQLCLLMARLEEAEHSDLARMREWLDRAARAIPDPRYVCASCGGESPDWHSLCPRCSAFDTLAWRTPVSAVSEELAIDRRLVRVLAEPTPAALPGAEASGA
jgi:HemY protein